MTMHVVLCSPVARQGFERRIPEAEGASFQWAQASDLPALAPTADAIVLTGSDYTAELAAALRHPDSRCRWVQLLSAGYEQLLQHGMPANVEVSNAGSVWSPIVAEHMMALLLAVARRIPAILEAQSRGYWDHGLRPKMSQLIDSQLVIVGMGSIGGELARRARAFGMRVTGVTRSGKPHPDADEVLPLARLHEALARADYVVAAVPLSPESQGLIGTAELAACPRHAVIGNVGRGPVIDSAALEQALRDGTIGGAALDVTDPEPLPPSSALWQMPNVIVSPHMGGAAPERYYERLVGHVVGNVIARVQGRPLNDCIEVKTR